MIIAKGEKNVIVQDKLMISQSIMFGYYLLGTDEEKMLFFWHSWEWANSNLLNYISMIIQVTTKLHQCEVH